MRTEELPFHRPAVGEEEIAAAVEVLRSGWLTTGPKVAEFEAAFAERVGAPHAIAVSSCTAALHVALAGLDLQPDDEVIVPTNTFAATAGVVCQLGARPVFAECRRDSFNIDERRLERYLSPKTRAIMPVHLAGQPVELDPILEFAQAHDLRVVEDAAHAFPASYGGRAIGQLGDATAFSFYATKPLTTGEGGMLTTADDALAERVRRLRLHGLSSDAYKRASSQMRWYYEIQEPGYKYNMPDAAAAMGLVQLGRAEALRRRRAAIAERYTQGFAELEAVGAPLAQDGRTHAWHLYIVTLALEQLSIDRAQVIDELAVRRIGSGVHYIPLHLQPFYRETFGYRPGDFPEAEWVYERCVSLPIFPDMTDGDVDDVIDALREITSRFRR